MRNFLIIGHRAVTTPLLSLNDLPGTGGRMDLITRAINNSFCISHDIRRDVEVAVVFLGPEDPPKTIRLIGKRLKYLNPDERSTGALIRNALIKISEHKLNPKEQVPVPLIKKPESDSNDIELLNGEIASSPGIYISDSSFDTILKFYSDRSTIIQLHENGTDISGTNIPDATEDLTFVLSDDKDFTIEEEDLIKKHSYRSISIGPVILHTDHCITIIHNYLDKIMK